METLLAFAAALLALRLASALARRWRARRAPELAAWSASLFAYALGSAALAWGVAAGWNEASFRVYYVCGAMLTAALLGVGSLLLVGWRRMIPVALVYAGLAVGLVVAEPLTAPVSGESIPDAQDHFDFVPVRVVAIAGNVLGTLAVVAVALATFARRPQGNAFILAGVACAAGGSTVAGLGVVETSLFVALGVVFLYLGFVAGGKDLLSFLRATPQRR